jgi:hypothetical protein
MIITKNDLLKDIEKLRYYKKLNYEDITSLSIEYSYKKFDKNYWNTLNVLNNVILRCNFLISECERKITLFYESDPKVLRENAKKWFDNATMIHYNDYEMNKPDGYSRYIGFLGYGLEFEYEADFVENIVLGNYN